MSHLSDIRSTTKTALAANATFTSANIFTRPELKGDHTVGAIDIFMEPLELVYTNPQIVADMRKYPIRFVIVFDVDGRANAPGATDTVMDNKGTYLDAALTALRTTIPGATYAVSGTYHSSLASVNMNYEEGPAYGEIANTIYRIAIIWEFFTYETQ